MGLNDKGTAVTMDRRNFLKSSLAASSAGLLAGPAVAADGSGTMGNSLATDAAPAPCDLGITGPIIDTNVYLGIWPFRRCLGEDDNDLVRELKARGVVEAWVGNIEGLFHKNVAHVNERLAAACARHAGFLIPFGTVNPALPDWEEDLRRCHEQYRMPGVRLHPNYQNYELDHPELARLLDMADQRGLVVQIVPWMEDARHAWPRMIVPDVDLAPLAELAQARPRLRLTLPNGVHTMNATVIKVMAQPNIWIDFARLELMDPMANLFRSVPPERILFGSFYPRFYFESTTLKLIETPTTAQQRRAILYENARALLPAA